MKPLQFLFIFLFIHTASLAQNEFKVEVSGSGEPVFLFPGFTCTSEVYTDLVKNLEKAFEVHNFTFAGFGDVAAIEKPWLPKIKSAIENYVETNRLNGATLIGHSIGGTLSLWLASDNPNLFKKLIIVDALPAMGALMIPNYNSENIVYNNPYNDKLINMDKSEFDTMANQMAASMTLNTNFKDKIANWIKKTDRKTYVYGYTDLLKLDLRNELQSISIPVTLLAATHPFGRETAEKNIRDQYKNLKDYNLNFAEGSGHFIMFDKPNWFLEQINKELNIQ